MGKFSIWLKPFLCSRSRPQEKSSQSRCGLWHKSVVLTLYVYHMPYFLISIQLSPVIHYKLIHVQAPYTFKHISITACYMYAYDLHIVNIHTLTHRHICFKAMDEVVFWDHVVSTSGNWYQICKTKAYGMTKDKPCVLRTLSSQLRINIHTSRSCTPIGILTAWHPDLENG